MPEPSYQSNIITESVFVGQSPRRLGYAEYRSGSPVGFPIIQSVSLSAAMLSSTMGFPMGLSPRATFSGPSAVTWMLPIVCLNVTANPVSGAFFTEVSNQPQ